MATQAGRRSIFREKARRVQGWLTKPGAVKFEQARKRLAVLAKRKPADVSDADTTEFLARGEDDTVKYLKAHAEG